MKKLRFVLAIVLILTVFVFSATAYATLTASLRGDIAEGKIYAGDTFVVQLSLKNVTASSGIKNLEAYIDLDETILEDITIDNIVKDSNGKVVINEDNKLDVYAIVDNNTNVDKGVVLNTHPVSGKGDCRLVINFDTPITADTDLIQFTFKVKADVEAGEHDHVVKFKEVNIFSSDAQESYAIPGLDVKVVVSEPSQGNEDPNNNTNNNTNTNTNSNNTNTNTNTNNNNTNKNTNTNTNTNTNKNTNTNTNTNTNKNTNTNTNTNKNTNTNTNSNKTNTNTNKGTNNNPAIDGSVQPNKSSTTDNTKSTTNLPKTGAMIVIPFIVIVSALGVLFYKKYSKMDRLDK